MNIQISSNSIYVCFCLGYQDLQEPRSISDLYRTLSCTPYFKYLKCLLGYLTSKSKLTLFISVSLSQASKVASSLFYVRLICSIVTTPSPQILQVTSRPFGIQKPLQMQLMSFSLSGASKYTANRFMFGFRAHADFSTCGCPQNILTSKPWFVCSLPLFWGLQNYENQG
jgi:hypothetical protein